MRSLIALLEEELLKSYLRLIIFNLDLLDLYICEALENIIIIGRDKSILYYSQRKLVKRRLIGEVEILSINFETL
jgi:hypothetical protein